MTTLKDLSEEFGIEWLKVCKLLKIKWSTEELDEHTASQYRAILAPHTVEPKEEAVSRVKTPEQRELGQRLATAAYERNANPTDWETAQEMGDAITEARRERWTWKLIAEWTGAKPDTLKKWADGIPVRRATGKTGMHRTIERLK